ncbi:hypothetical protein BH09MYX1_BH09MYX1_04350 [soil metagenome]
MPVKPAFAKSIFPLAFVALTLGSAAEGCGARTGLIVCHEDAECATKDLCATFKCLDNDCVETARTVCDDKDPCTADKCEKKTGKCAFTPSTYDLDGDGHRGPILGFEPGEPGACGDDCDDRNKAAFPGNKEICDGTDNDCDGIVDNGATYSPKVNADRQISPTGPEWAEPETIVRGDPAGSVRLIATYGASSNGQFFPYVLPLDALGDPQGKAVSLTGTVAGGSGSAVVWTGDRYGVVWADRRDGNFEIYFALLDKDGKKLAPGDERITVKPGFSIYPSLTWTGQEFVLVWQDEVNNDQFTILGQRIDLDGHLIGDIVNITPGLAGDQGPTIAAGRRELGLTWVRGDANDHRVMFQPLTFTLNAKAFPIDLTPGALQGVSPTLVFNRSSYVAAFFDPRSGKRAVYGAVVSGDGNVVVPATNITLIDGQSRDASLIALGDRVLFLYSDDRDKNSGFELYARTLWADLGSLGPPVRVTSALGDSIEPHGAFATDGTVLVTFRDDRGSNPAVFETGLACKLPQ